MTLTLWLLAGSGVCSLILFVWTVFAWCELIGPNFHYVNAVAHTNPMCSYMLVGSGDIEGAGPLQWMIGRSPDLKETLRAFGLTLVPGLNVLLLAVGLAAVAVHNIRRWLDPYKATRLHSKA